MPSRIYDNLGFQRISVSNTHSAGIVDGNIIGWGSSAKGKLDFPSGNTYVDVSCGYSHSSAVTDNGEIFSVGNPNGNKTETSDLVFHKSVRCSRNYTAATCEYDNEPKIVVYGDQSVYNNLPSSLYSREGSMGIFNLADVSKFDITDDGTLIVVNDKSSSGELCTIGDSKRILVQNIPSPVKKVVRGSCGFVAFYIDAEDNAFSISIDENGIIHNNRMGQDAVSVFSGKDYYGWSDSTSLHVFEKHFGKIKLPDGWHISDVVGGNNGYAVSVLDEAGFAHTILCGDNTKNKELVIEGHPHRENPRIKESIAISMDNMTYSVRPQSLRTPSVSGAVISTSEKNFECQPCGYKFLSNDSKCPICKSEVHAHA